MRFTHGQSVLRLRRQMVTDPYSGEESLGSWDDPSHVQLDGVAIDPEGSVQIATADGVTVQSQPTLYADLGVDVQAGDVIAETATWPLPAGTRLWWCEGDAVDWKSPFTGWKAGSATRLGRTVPDGLESVLL